MIRGIKKPKVSYNGTLQALSYKIAQLSGELGIPDSRTGKSNTQATINVVEVYQGDSGPQDLAPSNKELEAFATVFTQDDGQTSNESEVSIKAEATVRPEERLQSGPITDLITESKGEAIVQLEERIQSGSITDLITESGAETTVHPDVQEWERQRLESLYEAVGDCITSPGMTFTPTETGALYTTVTEHPTGNKLPVRVYLINRADSDGKYLEILSAICRYEEQAVVDIIREVGECRLSCGIATLLGGEFLALKHTLPTDVDASAVAIVIDRMISVVDRLKRLFNLQR